MSASSTPSSAEPLAEQGAPDATRGSFIDRLRQGAAGHLPAYGPPVNRRHYYLSIVGFALLVAALGMKWSGDPYRLGVMVNSLIFAIAAIGLYFAYTLGGLFAFSQGAFMGIGAYTSARISESNGFLAGLGAAIGVTLIVGIVLGFLLRKAKHLYFAIGALAFAEVCVLLFRNWSVFTGGKGAGNLFGLDKPTIAGYEFRSSSQVFWFVLATTCVVLVIGAWVERSPVRRSGLATKEIPMVAHANGVPVHRVVIFLFGFGCALAGLAGSLSAHSIGSITPEAFLVGLSINLYLMILLGGLGSMWGAVAGAFFVTWLPELLRPIQEYTTVVFSVLLLATIVIMPEGVTGTGGKAIRGVVKRVRGS
ncbi:MAG: branched-chain amino acid ABC transporter permease [Ilumatobacteraceae bacterium]|nr:branched-chain amino acid ABC transporter permease [Ilumatobacteraceae bacterium]